MNIHSFVGIVGYSACFLGLIGMIAVCFSSSLSEHRWLREFIWTLSCGSAIIGLCIMPWYRFVDVHGPLLFGFRPEYAALTSLAFAALIIARYQANKHAWVISNTLP